MPQMFPLSWMLMMPLSIFVLWVYLVMIYYMVSYFKYDMMLDVYKKICINCEW